MKKKVLIVDDNLDDLETMKNILEADMFDVRVANNGAKALDFLDIEKFSVILIDIKMPTLSGYDLLRLMKEKLSNGTRLIYVSILREKDVNLEGVDTFVQKPFSKASLLKAVRG